jgi:hypothetical protein
MIYNEKYKKLSCASHLVNDYYKLTLTISSATWGCNKFIYVLETLYGGHKREEK